MIRITICDDEKKLRKDLRRILENQLELHGIPYQITEEESGEALLGNSSVFHADILFLDIEMKQLDGVAAAKALRNKGYKGVIIFVTAYPDFVFQGYDVQALNYILKPYEKKKITEVLQAGLKQLRVSTEQFFTIEQKSGTVRLSLDHTLYFYSQSRTITAVTDKETVSFYGKLNDIAPSLPETFVRIHNRYLVNLNFISRLEINQVTCGDEALPVSRSCKEKLSIAFAKYMLG